MLRWIKSLYTVKNPITQLPTQTQIKSIPGYYPVLSAKILLSSEPHQQYLREIKENISTTEENYTQQYLPVIHNLTEFMQELSCINATENTHAPHTSLLGQSLAHTVKALKIRRAYMLPIGADTETCYQQQRHWTYAVFIASLLQECWQQWHIKSPISPSIVPVNCHLVKSLIPEAILTWLYEHKHIVNMLFVYLSGNSDNTNPLTLITEQAKKSKTTDNVSSPIPTPAQTPLKLSTDTNLSVNTTKETIESAQNSNVITKSLDGSSTDDTDITNQNHSSIDDNKIATQFLIWLKQQVKDKQLTINDNEAVIHRVEPGLLIVISKVIVLFQASSNNAKSVTEKSLIKSLISSQLITLDTKNKSYIHRYFKGQWETRNIVEGILLKLDSIYTDNEIPLPKLSGLHPYLF